MGLPPWSYSESQWFVMVTGSNSGIGFSICERTITEFLTSPIRPQSQHLVLIISTRSPLKTKQTISSLRQYLRNLAEKSSSTQKVLAQKALNEGQKEYKWQDVIGRVHFLGVELDLMNLGQVYYAAEQIKGKHGALGSPDLLTTMDSPKKKGYVKKPGMTHITIPRLDVLILNAGIGGWSHINWPKAVWLCIVDTQQAVTWWTSNISKVGRTVLPQGLMPSSKFTSSKEDETVHRLEGVEEPVLGEVFTANVFGHYVLAHELMPLLRCHVDDERAPGDRGRIIWTTSIESSAEGLFSIEDIQGLTSHEPYNSSKRLTDILSLTARLPGVKKASASWFATAEDDSKTKTKNQVNGNVAMSEDEVQPALYLAHPGICNTVILPLPFVLMVCKLLAFYLARLLGSIWHPITAYKGAVAATWLALSPQSTLDELDAGPGGAGTAKGKWGSSTDMWGNERVKRTEVPGWGWSGIVEDKTTMTGPDGKVREEVRVGRKRGAIDVTQESREDFEALGAQVWNRMEDLRMEWDRLLRN